MTISTRI